MAVFAPGSMVEQCIDSASNVMQEATGHGPPSPNDAAHKLHDAQRQQQKRPPASPKPQQSSQAAVVTQDGSRSSSVGAFGAAQWLLSAADAWRPSAAEFEAHCQVVGKLGKGVLTGGLGHRRQTVQISCADSMCRITQASSGTAVLCIMSGTAVLCIMFWVA